MGTDGEDVPMDILRAVADWEPGGLSAFLRVPSRRSIICYEFRANGRTRYNLSDADQS